MKFRIRKNKIEIYEFYRNSKENFENFMFGKTKKMCKEGELQIYIIIYDYNCKKNYIKNIKNN